MNNPVAPVEGPLYLLFTEYENTTNIRKWSKEPFYGAQEYVPVGELARLRAALKSYADLINKNIIENDGPNRFHLDGVTYEGPEVDAFFRILRGLEKLARTALEGGAG